jgi:hypothetical protein
MVTAEKGHPDYEQIAAKMRISSDKKIKALRAQRVKAKHDLDTIFHEKALMKNLADEVEIRKKIQTQTPEFPLIRGINDLALDILWTAHTAPNALRLAESLRYDGMTEFSIPVPVDQPNTRLITVDGRSEASLPFAVVRVGTYGHTSMVFFDQAIYDGKTTPAVVLWIGIEGVTGCNTEYTCLEKRKNRITLQLAEPFKKKFFQLYGPQTEQHLMENFLGYARYQTALSLVKPKS